jgi:predicted nucleotidyltransferase
MLYELRIDFQEKLKELVRILRERFKERLWGIVLFGSWARGGGTQKSDWDIFLIAEGLPQNPLERLKWLKKQLPEDLRGRVSFIAKTPQEFESRFPSYYLDIGLDGVILFDQKGYTERKLARIRELIEKAGLVRRRLNGGFIWEWQNPPQGPWRIDWSGVYGLKKGR